MSSCSFLPKIYVSAHIIGSASWPKKELMIPPIWGCCGPTGGSFLTAGQIKHPAFLRAGVYQKIGLPNVGRMDCVMCVLAAMSEKAGYLICSCVKYEFPVSPQQPQIGGIKSSFFWAKWHF